MLLGVAGLGSFICWIMVLIKMFQNDKPLIGILGFFCGLWAYIWGWMNASKLGLKKIMMIWTACFIVTIIAYIPVTMAAVKQAQEAGEIQINYN